MTTQANDAKSLGYTPINEEDVFKAAPALKDIIRALGKTANIYFKNLEYHADGKLAIEGSSLTKPSGVISDFRHIAHDYLTLKGDLTSIHRGNSDIWGAGEKQQILEINNPNDLRESLTQIIVDSIGYSAEKTTKSQSKTAMENLAKQIKIRNEKLALGQDIPEKPTEPFVNKCRGRDRR